MNENTINTEITMRDAAPAGGAKRFRPGDEILGRYVVEAELGQGGMGVVYLCLDKVAGVKVAVKGLPPEVSHNSDEMESVRDNFQLVSELQHPNIAGVRTLEVDAATGNYYLIMAYARGTSLKHWLRQHGGKKHRDEQMKVLRQIASALDYAHNAEPRHIIHRDIKPENVMVDERANVSVLDFGLAAQVRSSLSRVSQVVTSRSGTPAYKSPEQWLAQAQRAPSDQYSLGVIAYQMFAGELPYDSDDIEILKHAVVFDPVPPIQGETKSINAVFAKVLAKKPQERFASCAAFVDELGRARTPAAPSRRGFAAVLLGVLAVAALVGGGWWLGRMGRETGRSGGEAAAVRESKNDKGPKPGDTKTITLPGGATMEMVWCPPGSFMMGSPTSEAGRGSNETQHRVTLTQGFWMGKYEVTQWQWESVMGENPSRFKGADRPVEWVSWDDCQKFVQNINAEGRVTVSLPTEAQWEYACRAGTTTPFNFGSSLNGDKANCNGNYPYVTTVKGKYREETAPVGSYEPNAWGLYDMHGNVCEWCEDYYGEGFYKKEEAKVDPCCASGSYRVRRGGSWSNLAQSCRSAYRDDGDPSGNYINLGFRLCCSAGLRR